MPGIRSLILLAILAAILCLPASSGEAPAEAFCIVVIQPLNNFQQVRIVVDEELSSSNRDTTWDAADGDDDQTVTALEASAFRLSELQFWPSGNHLGNRTLALQAIEPYTEGTHVRPVYATTWRQLGHGFPGVSSGHYPINYPLSNPAALETQAVREYTFEIAGDPTHSTLNGGDRAFPNGTTPDVEYLPRAVIEYVVLLAPTGWTIDSVDGYGYNGSFGLENIGKASFELAGFDTSAPWSIRYANPAAIARQAESSRGWFPVDNIPGMPGLPLAAALVGLAWVGRRRQPGLS